MEQELENKIEKIAPTIEKYRNDKTMTSHRIAWEIIKQQEVASKNLVKADVIGQLLNFLDELEKESWQYPNSWRGLEEANGIKIGTQWAMMKMKEKLSNFR